MRRHVLSVVPALPAALLLLLLVAPGARPLAAQTPWPAEGWPRAEPEAVGLNPAVLDSIDAEIRAGEHGQVDRLLVIRRGRLAYDRRYEHDYERVYGDSARAPTALNDQHPTGPHNYFSAWWHPYYRDGDLHTLQSITKTVTSIAIGTAVTRGDFPSLDTPVLSYFDTTAVANLDERKKRMTIRHLLTMTAGLDWDEMRPYGDTANTADQMEASYDWVEFTIDRPMSDEPGSRFNYSSGATQLLAHVFYRATGVDLEAYAARHLFAPLGIRDWHWKRAPSGIVDAEGGLYLAPEDLARLWYLFLRDGAWDGSRIVSADWVRSSVAPTVTDVDPGMPPGSMVGLTWWLVPNPTDRMRHMWVGAGFGGQHAFAIPEDDLIVVVHQWNIVPGRPQLDPDRTIERILGAVTDRGSGGSPPAGRTSPQEAVPGTDAAEGSGDRPERLVYSSYRPAGWDVYLQGEEGSDPRRLTEHPALDYDATFSPDGEWLVYTFGRDRGVPEEPGGPSGGRLRGDRALPARGPRLPARRAVGGRAGAAHGPLPVRPGRGARDHPGRGGTAVPDPARLHRHAHAGGTADLLRPGGEVRVRGRRGGRDQRAPDPSRGRGDGGPGEGEMRAP